MVYLAATVHLEQTARLRKAGGLTALTAHATKFEPSRLLKAMLVRRDVYRHIAMTFPRMADVASEYDSPDFWQKRYNISPNGMKPEGSPAQEDPEEDVIVAAEPDDRLTTYESARPLVQLLSRLASNFYEVACPISNIQS